MICVLFGISLSGSAQAGFGISPPYVKTNQPIFPGSSFEQNITLIRSTANEDMQAEILVNAPEIVDWITIKQGEVFDLPKDMLKIPMTVLVDVPDDAEIGTYKGYINIRMAPKGSAEGGGGVAIALGARVDIDLTVTNEEFIDFNVRSVNIDDFEMLGFPWKYKLFSYFFHRIRMSILIENLGNTKTAPTKVHLDVYDVSEKNLLASYDDTSIKKVEPFKTTTTFASFRTDLEPGNYWGRIKIYKDNDIFYKNKVAFAIVEHGTLKNDAKLGIWPWLMLISIILFALIILLLLIKIRVWVYIGIFIYILSWPLRMIWKQIAKVNKAIKKKFWSYMHKKSSEYKDEE